MLEVLTTEHVAWSAIRTYLGTLWQRAQQEREWRTAKWSRNRLTEQGECVGPGGQGGDAADKDGDGAWRKGTKTHGGEKIRLAHQKIVAAKDIVGDSVYKANSMPFLLKYREESPYKELDPEGEVLASLTNRIKDILKECDIPGAMRQAVEDGASFGVYWLHETEAATDTGMLPSVDVPSPWEMFIDLHSEDDVERAEYVIRERRMTPYLAYRTVADAEQAYQESQEGVPDGAAHLFQPEPLSKALAAAQADGGDSSGQDSPSSRENGKEQADILSWREMWAYVPESVLEGEGDGGSYRFLPEGAEKLPALVPVLAVFVGAEMVSCMLDPGPRPYKTFFWTWNRMEDAPEGICDELQDIQTLTTGSLRAWAANVRYASRLLLAGKREYLKQDPEEWFQKSDGVMFVDLDSDVQNVGQAVQQFKVDSCAQEIMSAFELFFTVADMDSSIPRILQGQQQDQNATAFEIRNRLASAGKHLGEAVRLHDAAIVWVVRYILRYLRESGAVISDGLALPQDSDLGIQPSGFSAYSDLVSRLDAMSGILAMSAKDEELSGATRKLAIARRMATAQDLDPNEMFKSDDELQSEAAEAEKRAQEEAAAANRAAETDMEVKAAKAARDRAAAEDMAAKNNLSRAEFVRRVENDNRQQTPVQASGGVV